MKETTTRILCDICGKELKGYTGLSQFQDQWTNEIVIEGHSGDEIYKDICAPCNRAVLDLLNDRRP